MSRGSPWGSCTPVARGKLLDNGHDVVGEYTGMQTMCGLPLLFGRVLRQATAWRRCYCSILESVRTRKGVYQSRKRGLWYKGETSGATQVCFLWPILISEETIVLGYGVPFTYIYEQS